MNELRSKHDEAHSQEIRMQLPTIVHKDAMGELEENDIIHEWQKSTPQPVTSSCPRVMSLEPVHTAVLCCTGNLPYLSSLLHLHSFLTHRLLLLICFPSCTVLLHSLDNTVAKVFLTRSFLPLAFRGKVVTWGFQSVHIPGSLLD